MKLNLHILLEDLNDLGVQSILAEDPYTMPLRFATLASGAGRLKDDRLYIMEAGRVKAALADASTTMNILCIGEPPRACLDERSHNIAWTTKDVTCLGLLERINELFAMYSDWYDSLGDALSKNMPLRRLGECSEAIFDNPLWMWDSQLQTIFHVISKERYVLPEHYQMHIDGDPWPADEVNAINDTFRASLQNREPYVLPPMFGYHSLCYNLFANKKYTATISVDGVNGAFTDRERSLIKVLGDAMARGIVYQPQISKHSTFVMSAQIEKLLARESVPAGKLSASLAKKGWAVDDSYLCIVAEQASGSPYPDQLLSPVAETICDAIPNMMYVLSGESIVFIANLSMADSDKASIPEAIGTHLEKAKLHMPLGISTVFTNFAYLPFFRDQAEEALLIGTKKDAGKTVFEFECYLLDSIVHRLKRDTVSEVLYPPCLLKLQQYDRTHGADLVETLMAYLDNGLSTNRTAQNLYMHRNTLLGRLKKIESVGGIDLDDETTRLLLRIALALDGQR